MPVATLTWTALPNGLRRGDDDTWRARISVFVAMRLAPDDGSATLDAFGPLCDWPATLAGDDGDGPTLTVYVSDGTEAGPAIPANATRGGFGLDPVGWRAIFPCDTTVVAPDSGALKGARAEAAPPEPAGKPMSYQATEVLRRVRNVYTETLTKDTRRKTASTLSDFAAAAQQDEAPPTTVAGPAHSGGQNALAELAEFLAPADDPRRKLSASRDSDHFEFHQVVAGISGHPALMRRLGLVLDVEVPADALRLDGNRSPRIAVVPGGLEDPDNILRHECPWTAVEVDAATGADYRTFCAARDPETSAGDGLMHAGMRGLPGGTEHVAQEHLEHAFVQLVQHASEIEATPRGSEVNRDAPPALLQVGMRMLDDGAADDVHEAMTAQRALLARLGRNLLGANAAATHRPPDDKPLYAAELTRGFRVDVRDDTRDDNSGDWRSLCRRSSRYTADGWAWPDAGTPVEDEGTVTPSVYEDTNAKKTFSQATYRVVPDLFTWDGWSLVVPHPDAGMPDPDANAQQATGPVDVTIEVPAGSLQPQRFGRSYQFRARSVDIAGNSLTPDQADALKPGPQPIPGPTPAVPCLRVENVPPPVVFPAQPRGPGEAGGDVIVVRDAESPAHRTTRFRLHVLPPRTSVRTAERHGLFDALSPEASWELIDALSGTLDRDEQGNRRDYIAARTLNAPYLPDPLAAEAVMVLPGDPPPAPVVLPRFDPVRRRNSDDPLALACTLVVEGGNNELRTRVSGRTVTLTAPKGRITHVRLATRLDDAALGVMAVAKQATNVLRSPDALREAAASGDAPALAPSRTLEIVHATQRPLTAPVFVALKLVPREKYATRAVLSDPQFLFDLPSSGRLDVYARWEETVDDPALPAWRRTRNTLHAGGQTLRPDDETPFTATDPPADGEAAPDGARPPTLAHDFGDTRHREVTYVPIATSRFASLYPPELTADPANITREGPAITLHVPSTAPPDAPDIAYVVPTFERESNRLPGGKRTATQRGFGLRVYMRRGWFSSGDGEQLALVIGPAGDTLPVSEWGTDPTLATAPLPGPIALAHVDSDRTTRVDLSLSAQPLTLLLHDVAFGEAQGLPFADITFASQPTAVPLVRLALARYQPWAIDDCHLSGVVQADFVPLAPDRHLTVSVVSAGRWRIALHGQGYRDASGRAGIVEARIEQQPLSARADDAAWRQASDTVTLEGAVDAAYEALWQVELALLPESARGRWRRRLMLREFTSPRDGDGPLDERARLVSVQTVAL